MLGNTVADIEITGTQQTTDRTLQRIEDAAVNGVNDVVASCLVTARFNGNVGGYNDRNVTDVYTRMSRALSDTDNDRLVPIASNCGRYYIP